MEEIRLYGTDWCGDTRRVRNYLDNKGIKYQWFNIDMDDAAGEFVAKVNNGFRSVPTLVFPDGTVMVEPSLYELQEKLGDEAF